LEHLSNSLLTDTEWPLMRTAVDRSRSIGDDRHSSQCGHNRSFDIAAQIADNLLLAPAPTGAILHPKEP